MSKAQELAKCLDLYDDDQTAVHAAAELRRLDRVNAELEKDAARWRRLVNCSEMSFPIATVCSDPENDMRMVYGRKRLEDLIDGFDLIPAEYAALSSSGGNES